MYGNVTWWSWSWKSPFPKSPTVSVTCCCDRSGFCSVCLTVTLLCEISARTMSTGESFCIITIISIYLSFNHHLSGKDLDSFEFTFCCNFSFVPPASVHGWSSWCQVVQDALLCLATALHLVCATNCANRRMTFSSTKLDEWIQSVST